MRLFPLATAALLATAVQARAAEPSSGSVTVSQRNRSFSTPALSVARGETVHFTNDDDFTHQVFVDSPDFSYESDEQEPGRAVDLKFSKPGSFEMRCHIHPKMHMRVDVR